MDLNETVEVGDSVQIERKNTTERALYMYVRCHIQQHKMSHTLSYAMSSTYTLISDVCLDEIRAV